MSVALQTLGLRLTEIHGQSSQQGPLTVVPVIVDNLQQAMHVLHSVAKLEQGALLDTDADEYQGPVPASADQHRRIAVTAALTPLDGQMTARRVVIDDHADGTASARFDPPLGDPSGGRQTVLAFAQAVIHESLDRHELAIITYREEAIDLGFRRAVWNLGPEQLAGLMQPPLRTLIVVAQSDIDSERHCAIDTGFRFAVQGGRFLQRHLPAGVRTAAGALLRHDAPLVLFLGAGFSVSSNMPLGTALRDKAIKALIPPTGPELRTSQDLARDFYDLVVTHEEWLAPRERGMTREEYEQSLTLEQVLRIEQIHDPKLPTLRDFRTDHDRVVNRPGSAVLGLGELLTARSGKIILVTVNFDELVEVNCPVSVRRFATNEDFADAAAYIGRYLVGEESDIPLLKLHGTISTPQSCVVSREQTESGIGENKTWALEALLGQPDAPRLWFYVGASMRDLDLRPLLLTERFGRGLDERWVMPFLSETVERFTQERRPHWARAVGMHSVQDRLVSVTADAFFTTVKQQLAGPS